MSRPKIKPHTKPFNRELICPTGYRHRSYSDVIARMREQGICSDEKAEQMQANVDALTGEGSE
jgi:hypothetical protein